MATYNDGAAVVVGIGWLGHTLLALHQLVYMTVEKVIFFENIIRTGL